MCADAGRVNSSSWTAEGAFGFGQPSPVAVMECSMGGKICCIEWETSDVSLGNRSRCSCRSKAGRAGRGAGHDSSVGRAVVHETKRTQVWIPVRHTFPTCWLLMRLVMTWATCGRALSYWKWSPIVGLPFFLFWLRWWKFFSFSQQQISNNPLSIPKHTHLACRQCLFSFLSFGDAEWFLWQDYCFSSRAVQWTQVSSTVTIQSKNSLNQLYSPEKFVAHIKKFLWSSVSTLRANIVYYKWSVKILSMLFLLTSGIISKTSRTVPLRPFNIVSSAFAILLFETNGCPQCHSSWTSVCASLNSQHHCAHFFAHTNFSIYFTRLGVNIHWRVLNTKGESQSIICTCYMIHTPLLTAKSWLGVTNRLPERRTELLARVAGSRVIASSWWEVLGKLILQTTLVWADVKHNSRIFTLYKRSETCRNT